MRTSRITDTTRTQTAGIARILRNVLIGTLAIAFIDAPMYGRVAAAQVPTENVPAQVPAQDTSYLANAALTLIPQNVPASQYDQFRILLKQYFTAYQNESADKQNAYLIAFAGALQKRSDFDTAVKNATTAENKPANLTAEQQIANAEAQVDGPLATSMNALIQNLLTGTTSDFNHKIVDLAGVYFLEPDAAPAIYLLFQTLNDQYYNDAYFRGLIRDSNGWEQFRHGAVVTIGIAAAALVLTNPRMWARAGQTLSRMRGPVRDTMTGAAETLAASQLAAERIAASRAASRLTTSSIMAKKEIDQRFDSLHEQINRAKKVYGELWPEGHDKQTHASLLQDAISGDAKARSQLDERIQSGEVSLNMPQPDVLQRASRLRAFSILLGANPLQQIKALAKLVVGIGAIGGAADVGGLHQLYMHVQNNIYGSSIPGVHFVAAHMPFASLRKALDPSTRVVPLDAGHGPDLLNRAYNALAALKLSCDADQLLTNVASLAQTIANAPAPLTSQQIQGAKDELTNYTLQLVQYLMWEQFLTMPSPTAAPNSPPVTMYEHKQFVPNFIRYDSASRQIIMDLPEGRDTIHQQFACQKYARGFYDGRLEVSLDEAYEQLSETYRTIVATDAALK